MSEPTAALTTPTEEASGDRRLPILLAMAMFVLVVDTSIMNVSISAVVADLGTTVSAIQSAIAIEALVSAAFILIGSKIGDLFGRKRAYVLGLLAYAIGALSMALADSVTAIIIFWAIIGGLGASLLLPAMQSLIHGNFEGKAQKATYALVGAAAAIAAAVGPLIGGFITTFLSSSRRVRAGGRRHRDRPGRRVSLVQGRPVHGPAPHRPRRRGPVGLRHGRPGAGHPRVAGGWGSRSALLLAVGALSLAGLAYWLVRRKREGKPTLIDPALFTSRIVPAGIPGRCFRTSLSVARWSVTDLPPDGPRVQRPPGWAVPGAALAEHVRHGDPRRQARRRPPSRQHHPGGLRPALHRDAAVDPIVPRADAGWYLAIPLLIAGVGLGLLVSQLNNYTLAPIEEERVSEAAGVNSAAGSFGLSFGLAFAGAIMLATLAFSFTNLAESSTVLTPEEQVLVADALEHDAEVMTNTALDALLVSQPPDVKAEMIRINTEARPFALQVALLIPIFASLLGFLVSLRMARQPDPVSAGVEGLVLA